MARRLAIPSKEQLEAEYDSGLSTNELADRYSVSKGTIYNWFKKYGIECRTPRDGGTVARDRRTTVSTASTEVRLCNYCNKPFYPPLKTSQRTLCSDACLSAAGMRRTRSIKRGTARSGRRESLGGLYVRSSWEASYAAVLNEWKRQGRITDWKYEPKTFVFDRISRGNRSYTPDFQVFYPDGSYEWHEVKGFMDAASQTKLHRFEKYFPEEFQRFVLIDKAAYKQLGAKYGDLPGWES